MPDIADRVSVEPRSAVTQYLTAAGLSASPSLAVPAPVPAPPVPAPAAPEPAPDVPATKVADPAAPSKPKE